MIKKRCISGNLIGLLIKGIKNDRDRLLVKILYSTSCKANEIIGIKLNDIKEDLIFIKDRKSIITADLFNQIQSFASKEKINSSDYIFKGRQSLQITTKRVRQIVQSYSKDILGENLNPEDIRKISIKDKLSSVNVKEISKEVGLKRFDKRYYLSKDKIKILENSISDRRTEIIFYLLLNGLKSSKLTELKVKDIANLNLKNDLKEKIIFYSEKCKLSNEDPIFLTRQKSCLTKERIFQIITKLSVRTGIKVSPRDLNNTAIADSLSNVNKLNGLGIKTQSFCLHGGFVDHE